MNIFVRLIRLIYLVAQPPEKSFAGKLLQEPTGDVAGPIKKGCTPCCYVETRSPDKPIRATLMLALSTSVTLTRSPHQKGTFLQGDNILRKYLPCKQTPFRKNHSDNFQDHKKEALRIKPIQY